MDIRQMKYFHAIVKYKTFTKAAQLLHISQPSLSSQIKDLEKELGCVLFERTTKIVSLTEAGINFLKLITPILEQENRIYQEMEDLKEIGLKKVNIGILPSQVFLLPKIILQFKKKYPNIAINIFEMGSKDMEKSLEKYDIHLGLTSPISYSKFLTYLPVYEEELFIIAPFDHPFKTYSHITTSDLIGQDFISYKEGYSLREILLKVCSEAGFKPNIMYECGRLETIRQLVISGMGIAIVPENYIRFAISDKMSIIKIVKSDIRRPLNIIMSKDRHYPKPVHDLKNYFFDFFIETS
ncbi:LysR family transcriptional regulator [Oceanobacillus halophilus]|uniref:LysR family transcriptional regulator n=1 Tax=Oceanobacillus halophilus TaxID=930130 RepID=A0A495A7X8_9BACI|nr:LysR family transcriptional regulator [Oceanobacillus halophilus]RKQ35724.1 LysR family transcriptional regulator [Oceanobacillus halophilus]